jgi:hypothetical protein
MAKAMVRTVSPNARAHTHKADPEAGECSIQYRRSAAPEHQPEGAEKFRRCALAK